MYKKILLILVILWHSLIFFQSSLSGDTSSLQSGFIVDVIYPFLNGLGLNLSITEVSFYIRKLAHFTEYFILGLILYAFYRNHIKSHRLELIVILHGIIVACLDETLQTFIINRSGEVRDVLIDTLGVISAILLITTGRIIYERQTKKSHLSN